MKLSQNPWKKWGFSGNPFNTKALSLNSNLLPISKAFVGRHMDAPESTHLLQIISNPGGGCGIVEGEIGVGKTTLVNYHRYLWEKEAEDRLLTPVREISVYGRWEAKDFLMDILGHISHKLLLVMEQQKKKLPKLLKKLQLLHEVFYHESIELEGSFLGFGIGYGNQPQVNVPSLMESQLINYLSDLIDEIMKMGYKGVFLHFDNLELLTQPDLERCRYLFDEIRDILQFTNIYYIFVARIGFFGQVIAPLERVRSIMGWPVHVPPLTCAEVIEAINTRYNILAIQPGREIKPVSDSFIERLYKLYGGKIRFIMDSIAQISMYYNEVEVYTLRDEEAQRILFNIMKVKTSSLSYKELQTLQVAIKLEEFTTDDLSRTLKMKPPNVSKIIKRLAQENMIYYIRREGQRVYYRIMEELKVLMEFGGIESLKKSIIEIPPTLLVSKMKARLEKLSLYLETHDKITSHEYQRLAGVSASTAREDIGVFIKKGVLHKEGDKKGTCYVKVSSISSQT